MDLPMKPRVMSFRDLCSELHVCMEKDEESEEECLYTHQAFYGLGLLAWSSSLSQPLHQNVFSSDHGSVIAGTFSSTCRIQTLDLGVHMDGVVWGFEMRTWTSAGLAFGGLCSESCRRRVGNGADLYTPAVPLSSLFG